MQLHSIGLHTSTCMIIDKLVSLHVWPINGVLVTLFWDLFHKNQVIQNQMTSKSIVMEILLCVFHLFSYKFCKCQVIQNHMTQKSITMEILHARYVTSDKLQCHTIVVFLSVLRRLASVSWMFNIIIMIHNIQPIHNGSMAFILFMISTTFCSLEWITSLQQTWFKIMFCNKAKV